MRQSTSADRLGILAVLAGMAVVVLDAGAVNVALPKIAVAFEAHPSNAISVVGAYQAAVLIGLLPCGYVAQRLGQRRLYVAGLMVFSAASLLSAMSTSLATLIVSRFLQGLGGAAILALGIALVRSALGPERLGAAIAWNAVNVALCSAAGPVIGGLLLAFADWRALFLISVPVALVALIAARWLPEDDRSGFSIDRRRIALYTLSVGPWVLAFGWAGTKPVLALGLFIIGGLCSTVLVRSDLRSRAPLIPFDLLRRPVFRAAIVASVLCFTGQSAALLALPFYLQEGLGYRPAATGFILSLWPTGVILASSVATPLIKRLSGQAVCAAGALTLGLALAVSAFLASRGAPMAFAACTLVCGVGFGLFQVSNNQTMFLAAPAHRSAAGGGMQGSARLTGQATGSVVVAFLFSLSPMALVSVPAVLVGAALFVIAAASVSLVSMARQAKAPHQLTEPA